MLYEITSTSIISVDDNNGAVSVVKSGKVTIKPYLQERKNGIATETHEIGNSEYRYGYLTFKKNSTIRQLLVADEDVSISCGESSCLGHCHKHIPGRVDRLSTFFRVNNINLGSKIKITYDSDTKKMTIGKLQNE